MAPFSGPEGLKEAEASERSVMAIKHRFSKDKPRSKALAKILDDFPWLWGINPSWPANASVKIVKATVDLVAAEAIDPRRSYWVKAWSERHGHSMLMPIEHAVVMRNLGGCVANAAIEQLYSVTYEFEFIAIRHDDGSIVVYRPPKGEDLHRICVNATRKRMGWGPLPAA